MNVSPIYLKDGYKVDHRSQYPKCTQEVYSNFTPRDSRYPGIDKVAVFGIQAFAYEVLLDDFQRKFFYQPKELVLKRYQRRMDNYIGPGTITVDHIGALHDLGYLPLDLKALPEGTLCPMKTPVLTIRNTLPEFFWLPNMLETLLSSYLWHPMTTATVAFEYRKMLTNFARLTSDIPEFVPWQGHDFSFRGQSSPESATRSGSGHLLSFTGTDTIPAIEFLEDYYHADCTKELIGGTVAATEHSVMSMGSKESELETYRRLLTEVYHKGIVSVVSDTYDYWKVLTEILPKLKDVIMARDGKLVIRPDSGDPVKVVCGDPEAPVGTPQHKGTVKILAEIFGSQSNSKGYRQLDPHIGVIYGDSITMKRCDEICSRLLHNGFASTNVVFGIGSYTYQYVTRDVFGFAMKATHGVINGKPVDIFKDPATDNGVKKSAKGYLRVNADLTLSQQVSRDEEREGLLQTVFLDGKMVRVETLSQIRARLLSQL
jgi:nicotinamide phosphoribosyltransferase